MGCCNARKMAIGKRYMPQRNEAAAWHGLSKPLPILYAFDPWMRQPPPITRGSPTRAKGWLRGKALPSLQLSGAGTGRSFAAPGSSRPCEGSTGASGRPARGDRKHPPDPCPSHSLCHIVGSSPAAAADSSVHPSCALWARICTHPRRFDLGRGTHCRQCVAAARCKAVLKPPPAATGAPV